MKSLEDVKRIISSRINNLKERSNFYFSEIENEKNDLEKCDKIRNLFKKEFKTIYQLNYEISELIICLKRIELCENKDKYMDEIRYMQDFYRGSLLNDNIASTTSMSYNLATIYERETMQSLMKFYSKLYI